MLRKDGILILGQDLTNKEDLELEKEEDSMHPIYFDKEILNNHLSQYTPLFSKTLSRTEGRNPHAHYATLLFYGVKS
jgi:hypothetical protein